MSRSRACRSSSRWPSPDESAALDRTGATLVGVSGSSGKSVTVALLYALLRSVGVRVTVGLGSALEEPDRLSEGHCVLLELPAAQSADGPSPLDYLVVTGLRADELPPNVSLPSAADAIGSAMTLARRGVIVNADDARALGLAACTRSPVLTAGLNGSRTDTRLVDGTMVFSTGAADLRIVAVRSTSFSHPALLVDMALAATTACALGVGPDQVRAVLQAHSPVHGRLEELGTARAVRWVDDTSGNRPGRAAAALEGLTAPVVLLAGGRLEGHSLTRWVRAVSGKAAHVLLFGSGGPLLSDALGAIGLTNRIVRCADLEDAVTIVPRLVERGDTVLYSPGAMPDSPAAGRPFRDLVPLFARREEAA